jgi:hypothetical protein
MQKIEIGSRICLREGVQVRVCGRKHVAPGGCEGQYLCNLTNGGCGRWIGDYVRDAAHCEQNIREPYKHKQEKMILRG